MRSLLLLFLIPLFLSCSKLGEFTKPAPTQGTICVSNGHVAFPSVVKLYTGDLVAVFRGGSGHVSPDGNILLCRSRNGGHTWSDPDIVIDTRLDCRDPSIVELPDGSILLNFFQSRYDSSGKIIGALGVFVARSYDGGQTYLPARMVQLPDYQWSACSDEILVREDNTLLLPVYGAKEEKKSAAMVVISRDMCKTWDEAHTIAYDSTGRLDFNEPALVDLPDGRILCILRTAGHGHFQYQCYSEDGGKTWSEPFRMNIQGQAAGLLLTDDNILVCAYRDFSPPGVSYSLSYDFGQTWEHEHLLSATFQDRAYVSLVELGKGKQFAVYYQAGKSRSSILGAFLHVTRPSTPKGLVASVQPDTTVSLRWNHVPEAHYYKVFRSGIDSLAVESAESVIANCIETTFIYNDIKYGEKYSYRVTAVASSAELVENSGAESLSSEAVVVEVRFER